MVSGGLCPWLLWVTLLAHEFTSPHTWSAYNQKQLLNFFFKFPENAATNELMSHEPEKNLALPMNFDLYN